MSLWCKLWNLLLNAFTDVVDIVASAVETLGEVGLKLLGGVLDVVASGSGGFLLLAGVGLLAFYLFKKDDSTDVKLSYPQTNQEEISEFV